MRRLARTIISIFALPQICLWPVAALAQSDASLRVKLVYAEQKFDRAPRLSGLRPVPEDLGWAGAKLGLEDNQTTGKFLNHTYELSSVIAGEGQDLAAMLKPMLGDEVDFIVLNAPAAVQLAIAALPEAKDKILFNASSRDEALREENCRKNLLHVIPSRGMLSDALAQFYLKKNWRNWFLISGSRDNDKAFADAIRTSATKFGLTITGDISWDSEADMRESAAVEVPLLTQAGDYDAVIVSDENDDFGPVLAYNSWLARPLAGTHGLVATGWSPVVESWGAVQLQNRFTKMNGRDFQEVDFAAWLSVRIAGEAVSRLGDVNADTLRTFILSEDLQMSAFKGRGLTFRTWNGQLRQPVHLVTSDTQVASAPFDDFLHENNDMDTLGKDRPETLCHAFD